MERLTVVWLLAIIIFVTILLAASTQLIFLKTLSNQTYNETNQSTSLKLADDDLQILNVEWNRQDRCPNIGADTSFYPACLNNVVSLLLDGVHCRKDIWITSPSSIIAYVRCKNDNLYCEHFVNGKRSDYYPPNGLQKCENELVIAEQLKLKPDYVVVTGNYTHNITMFYSDYEEDKNIMVCCSYLNSTTGKIMKSYEVCKSTTLKALCVP